MHPEDSYFKALLIQHGKPVMKQALSEWLVENSLALVSTKPLTQDEWISTRDAARLLGGLDRHTLYSYIKQGLPAKKIGKSYKFQKSEIEKFLNSKK